MNLVASSPIRETEDILRSMSELQLVYDPPAEGPTEGKYAEWDATRGCLSIGPRAG